MDDNMPKIKVQMSTMYGIIGKGNANNKSGEDIVPKIKIKFPLHKKIKYSIDEFFRILSGKQYCCNCENFFDYCCEFCYKKHPEQLKYKRVLSMVKSGNFDFSMSKFKPVKGNDKFWSRLIRAFGSLHKKENEYYG